MDPALGTDLVKWVGEFGLSAGVLIFVLVRLEARLTNLQQTIETHNAWLQAWVQAHAQGRTIPSSEPGPPH